MKTGAGDFEGKRIDPRTERTTSAIWEALLKLIPEKGYAAISVRDIAARARVNRATFYRYFEDKDDLFRRGCVELFDSIIGGADIKELEDPSFAIDQLPVIIAKVFELIEKDKETIGVLIGPNSNPEFRDIITDKFESIIFNKRLKLWDSALGLFEEPALAEAYVCAISATLIKLIMWWRSYPEPISAERIGSIYKTIAVGCMKELIASRGGPRAPAQPAPADSPRPSRHRECSS